MTMYSCAKGLSCAIHILCFVDVSCRMNVLYVVAILSSVYLVC